MIKHKKKEQEKAETETKEKVKETKEKKHEVAAGAKENKDEKIKELTESLQRLQAEFENYKKRTEKDMSSFARYANEELIKKLLPFIDDFELALKNCRAKDEFYKGIELIYAHLIEALQFQGLKTIEAQGKKFDPYFHEVLLTEESDKEQNIVLDEMQKGYLLGDKVLRHSKVKIAKKKKVEDKEEKKQEKEK